MKLSNIKETIEILFDDVDANVEMVEDVATANLETFGELDKRTILDIIDCAECAASRLGIIADLLRDAHDGIVAQNVVNHMIAEQSDDETADKYAGVNRDFSGGRYDGT